MPLNMIRRITIKAPISRYALNVINHDVGSIGVVRPSFLGIRNVSSDLGNPQSSSSEQSHVKTSRATDGGSPDTASVQTPVSNQSKIPGEQDEGTPSHDEVKRDPNEPAEKKRAHVESQGKKPLGPEDHQ